MPEHRFWPKVDVQGLDECWPWLGGVNDGYGLAYIGDNKHKAAHRLAFELWWSVTLPSWLHVLHTCDNPPCCNPAHLWLGTNADNVRDRDAKGRTATKLNGRHNTPWRRDKTYRQG